MKTFNIDIDELFKKGLRPRDDVSAEGSFLLKSKNAKPSPLGISQVSKYQNSFPTITTDADILDCYDGIYVAADTTIYTYSNNSLLSVLSGIPVGNRWSFADFRGYTIFTNGVTNVIGTSYGQLALDAGIVVPIANTICAFKGRLILGGVAYLANGGGTLSSNAVSWTEIGNLKILDTTDYKNIRKNTSGYMPMPWKGVIYAVLPLDNSIIIYGDGGIAALYPTHVGDTYTFGLKELSNIGIYSQTAVTHVGKMLDTKLHYFLRADGKLFSIDTKLEMKELDYSEFLYNPGTLISEGIADSTWLADGSKFANGTTSSAASSIRVSHDSSQDEVLIMKDSETYVLTKFGLGHCSAAIGDAYYNSTYGLLVHSKTPIIQNEIELCSDIITANSYGKKGLEFISISYKSPERIMIAIETRDNPWATFISSDWKLLNSDSTVRFSRLGTEFKIKIRVSNYTKFNLSKMRLAFQFRDRRARRGVSINTLRS